MTQAVSSAASLGIPEAIAENPRELEPLAAELGCHAPSLKRLLDVLVGEGLVEERGEGYVLTRLGEPLRPGALGELARFVGSRSQWDPWPALAEAVRTGRPAFELVHGEGLFDYLAQRPDEAALYDRAVDAFTGHEARALAEAHDFTDVDRVVDVGGGYGTALVELLGRWPHLHGTLLDLEHVGERARLRVEEAGLDDRCRVEAGDFTERVPSGADAYVLKRVLHNWGDAEAARILARCAEAMAPGGRILVVEGVKLPGNRRDGTRLLDLEMLALTAEGRERTKPELRQLFRGGGLELAASHPLTESARLLVGRRR